MKLKNAITVVISLVGLIVSQAIYAEDNLKKVQDLSELKVLAFGTSNIHGGVRYISEIAAATEKYQIKREVWILNKMKPSSCCEGLWNAIQQNEEDPANNDISVKYRGQSVREYLQKEKWDAIILSSHCLTATYFRSETVTKERRRAEHKAFSKCLEYIKKYAPQARLLYYNTYSFAFFDKNLPSTNHYIKRLENREGQPIKNPFDFFLQDIKADVQRCQDVCREFSLGMIPTRQVVWLAHVDPEWGHFFTPVDKKHALTPPQLPAKSFRPSLMVGYKWKVKNGKKTLTYDSHIGMAGSYLVGCLLFQALTGKDAIGNCFVPKEKVITWNEKGAEVKLDEFQALTAEECAILQRIAAKTMEMKNDPPEHFIKEYVRLREKKLENKKNGKYKPAVTVRGL